jgi:hypothetical protein
MSGSNPRPLQHRYPASSNPMNRAAVVAKRIGSATALLALATLGGCTENGDFGRPRASVWNDTILPFAGGYTAGLVRGEPVSTFMHTDDEAELRDRAWHFITPAHDKLYFHRQLAELVRTRIAPVQWRPVERAAYHRALMHRTYVQMALDERIASPASRYRRLAEDAWADAELILPFAAIAARVLASDRIRLKALQFVRDLDEGQIRDAAARVAENRCLVAWVRQETMDRADAYAYALERLVVEAPQGESSAAERAVAHLEGRRAAFDEFALPPFPAACGDLRPPASEPVTASRPSAKKPAITK